MSRMYVKGCQEECEWLIFKEQLKIQLPLCLRHVQNLQAQAGCSESRHLEDDLWLVL